MRDAAETNRPSKREVIVVDDNDSTIKQPVAKSARREAERFSPPEVLQGAVVDGSTKGRVEELEQKLAAVSKQLDGARRRAENAFARKIEVTRENESLRSEIAEMKIEVNSNCKVIELTRENKALKSEMAEMKKEAVTRSKALESAQAKAANAELVAIENQQLQERVNILTNQLGEVRRVACEDRTTGRARIDELSLNELHQFAQCEGWLQPPPVQQLQQLQPYQMLQHPQPLPMLLEPPVDFSVPPPPLPLMAIDRTAKATPARSLELLEVCHATNIFQLCRPNTPGSVSIDLAFSQLWAKYDQKASETFRRYGDFSDVELECELCLTMPLKFYVLDHFLSPTHNMKMRAAGAAVSLAALNHWLGKLQQASEAAAAAGTMQPAAAVAASPGVGEVTKKEIKKEIE